MDFNPSQAKLLFNPYSYGQSQDCKGGCSGNKRCYPNLLLPRGGLHGLVLHPVKGPMSREGKRHTPEMGGSMRGSVA